jgi:type VI secretion system protein ImpE
VTARDLFDAGELDRAIETLGAELRKDPTDVQRRVFLFELLSFVGEYERAEKQLDVAGQSGREASQGALLYRSALHAEKNRQEMFEARQFPVGGVVPKTVSGTLNGTAFQGLTDADPRLGARLEVFAAGQYLWIPLEHVASIEISPPKRLRDLIWTPAIVQTGPGFSGIELGQVLIPAISPLSWQYEDTDVRLGRVTEWVAQDDGAEVPVGQKLFLVDGEEIPILELRTLEFSAASG